VAKLRNVDVEEGSADRDEPYAGDEALCEIVMDMQGLGKPKVDEGQSLIKIKKRHKKATAGAAKVVDDDYLAGPMTIDTYVTYRVRPVMMMLQKRATARSQVLGVLEIVGFCIQSSGAIFGTFEACQPNLNPCPSSSEP
jgi:hypothetical protein